MLKNFYGMRTIKTGIAASLSLIIAQLLGYTNPIFIVIAAIFSMNKTVHSSFKSGLQRLTGTAFGAITGLLFILVFPSPNFLLIGIGLIIVIGFCNCLNIQNAIFLSCVVFCNITLDIIAEVSPFMYSLNRFFDTFLGIAIAILVNFIFRPYNNTKVIKHTIKDIQININSILKTIITSNSAINLSALQSKINFLNDEITDYQNEFFRKKKHYKEICVLQGCKQLLNNIIIELTSLSSLRTVHKLSLENLELIKNISPEFETIENTSCDCEECSIFNFHTHKMLIAYNYLAEYIELF